MCIFSTFCYRSYIFKVIKCILHTRILVKYTFTIYNQLKNVVLLLTKTYPTNVYKIIEAVNLTYEYYEYLFICILK